jgi:hypothetical protein
MNTDQFWKIVGDVNRASNGDMDAKCELLRKALRKLPAEEVMAFAEELASCRAKAYTWELWAAAYIIGGGCSNDSFSDFRSALISMGREMFERVVTDPGNLVDTELNEDNAFYEGYQYVPREVYQEITGGNMPPYSKPHPQEPSGKNWKEETVAEIYPELARKHGYQG